jgi:hypothetical protein
MTKKLGTSIDNLSPSSLASIDGERHSAEEVRLPRDFLTHPFAVRCTFGCRPRIGAAGFFSQLM